jgi:hypothetical protein
VAKRDSTQNNIGSWLPGNEVSTCIKSEAKRTGGGYGRRKSELGGEEEKAEIRARGEKRQRTATPE